LADVWFIKSNEIGSDNQIHSRTHLGHLLKPGDVALAFDMASANINEPNFEKYERNNSSKIPDAIIVKKHFGDKVSRNRKRQWKLRRIDIDRASDGSSTNRDYMDFMEDLEEDPILRQNINIYADKEKMENTMAVDVDELEDDAPKITLQEMLEDLVID
jgi:nonsense-mediated mRNA decay protein 3